MFVAPQVFGRSHYRDGPAVLFAALVKARPEVLHDQVCLHLELCERAFDLFEEIKPEDNNIVRMWQECGLQVRNAGDSQALIQLKKEYCDKKECLRCRIGREYLLNKVESKK